MSLTSYSRAMQAMQNYWQNIPHNTKQQMIYSSACIFFMRGMIRNDWKAGAIAGFFAATATAIHALVTPLFKKVIGTRTTLTWEEEMGRTFIAIIGTGCITAAFGHLSIIHHLFSLSLIYSLLISFSHQRRHINCTGWFGALLP